MADDAYSTETWRVINWAPDYAVSSLGRVKRVRPDRMGRGEGRIIRPRLTRHGYLDVQLRIDGADFHYKIHVLVCSAFNGPKKSGEQVRHLDGVRTNNAPGNLSWGTSKQNSQDAEAHGTRPKGARHGRAKLSEADVGHILISRESTRELGRKFNVSNTTIQKVRAGTNWAHLRS